jgi:hypothetical protein
MRQRCEHALSTPRPFGPWEHLPCGEPCSPRSVRLRHITSKNIETLLGEPPVRPLL